ncbi:MAG: class I SAM-dependent methyltransferase [Thermodesulfobacteriota bacterium]
MLASSLENEMTSCDAWENIYAAGRHGSVWPWSELVSLVMRHVRPDGRLLEVLEIGVGAGANIPFVLSIGGRMSAIDGSATAIARLQERFAGEERLHLAVGDFTRSLPFDRRFDMVIDRGSLTHNDEEGTRRTLTLLRQRLKPGGWLFCLSLFAAEMKEAAMGKGGPDCWTRCDIENGPLAGTGTVHFWTPEHVRDVFSSFEIVTLEHHGVRHLFPEERAGVAYYNLVARQPG